MRIYIIEYRQFLPAGGNIPSSHISQEGYASLEAAQKYIAGRPNSPGAVTAMFYQTVDGCEQYIIHDIRIIEQPEAVSPLPPRPYERTRAAVYATGNRWAIENFNATHG